MSERLTPAELDSYLYESADILRDTVPGAEYQNYIFPLLFLKRISDVYDEEREIALKKVFGNEAALAMYKFSFNIPEGSRWSANLPYSLITVCPALPPP